MPVTQKDIARELGLDVSTVNKVLHKVPGAVFKKSTIELVFRQAQAMGYKFDQYSKGWAMTLLREIFPEKLSYHETAALRRLPVKTVIAARKVLYGK